MTELFDEELEVNTAIDQRIKIVEGKVNGEGWSNR